MVRRTLNIKVLIVTLAALAALGGGLFAVHAWQVSRTAGVFLVRADQQEQDSNWIQAAGYIDRYLTLRPRDDAARVRLALVFAKGAASPAQKRRAVDLCYRAIVVGGKSQENDLRQRLAALLLESGRFAEADREARQLLKTGGPGEAPAARVLALALWGQWLDGSLAAVRPVDLDIVEQMQTARRLNPTDVDLAVINAALHRRHARLVIAKDKRLTEAECRDRADRSLDELIAASPKDPKAFLARHLYRVEYQIADSQSDLETALRLAPDLPEALLVAGADAYRRGTTLQSGTTANAEAAAECFRSARAHYQRAATRLDKDPRQAVAYSGLGESCAALGEVEEAIGHWRKGAQQITQPVARAQLLGRVADVLLATNRVGDADPVLLEIDEILNRLGASVKGSELLRLNRSQNLRRALSHVKGGRPAKAVELLQLVIAAQTTDETSLEASVVAYRLLGDVCASANQWLEAAAAYDRAGTLRPADYAARMAAANAWLMAGRPALAADEVERVLIHTPALAAWLLLATAELRQQSSLSSGEQSWTRFEQALEALEKRPSEPVFPAAWRIALLRADYEMLRARQAGQEHLAIVKVADLLRQVEQEHFEAPDCPLQLILFYEHLGLTADADRALARLESLKAPGSALAIAGARLSARRGDFQRAASLLDEALGKAPIDQQEELRREAIQIAMSAQDHGRAENLLQLELKLHPRDVAVMKQLAELEIIRGKPAALLAWEQKLDEAGDWGQPLVHYFCGYRKLLTAAENERAQLQEALEEQSRVVALRPEWAEAYVLRGMIERRLGRIEPAVTAYQQAIDLGMQRVGVYEELIAMLDRLNRPADCNRYLSRLSTQLTVSQRLTQLAGSQELRQDNPERAVEIAWQRVNKQPDDPLARLWLGRVLQLANKLPEARRELERAVELAPADARVWSGLFSFFMQTGDAQQARATLVQLGQRAKLEPAQRGYILAQGYEMLGDAGEATRQYQVAVAASPKSADVHIKMAGLYLRRDPRQAEACLRRALEIDPSSQTARRTLAVVLTTRGGVENLQQAESLLVDLQDRNLAVEDRRLHALVLLARQDKESLQRAIQIMDQIVREGTNPGGDRLLLAQLYQRLARLESEPKVAAAKREAARQQLVTVASGADAQPAHIAALIDFLLESATVGGQPTPQQLTEAGVWLNKLEEVITAKASGDREAIERLVKLHERHGSYDRCGPWLDRWEASGKDPLRVLSLRAELLTAQGHGDQAEALIEAKAATLPAEVGGQAKQAPLAKILGDLYTRIANHAAAERWYRKLLKDDPSQYSPLVHALARQGRMEEALTLCEETTSRENTHTPALVMMSALSQSTPQPEHLRRADAVISAALAKFQTEPDLLYAAALLRIIQERYDDAARLLHETLKLRPEHIGALNNLAMVLAEDPKQYKAARDVIERAIQIAGTQGGLLDTKGTILVYDGDASQAVGLLEQARNLNADPRHRFHLALAYRDVGEMEKAKIELRLALEGKLEGQLLTPTDRRLLTDMKGLLAP